MAFVLVSQPASAQPQSHAHGMNAEQLSHAWDKVFPKSEKVEYRKVRFKNRYGITLAADLYLSKTHSDRRFAALAFMNMPMLTYINAISPRRSS